MAILDKYKLTRHIKISKLTPSSRTLLDTLAIFTDKCGYGKPTWYKLMKFSGIVGKDTFLKSREQLRKEGLITFHKDWTINRDGEKARPKAEIWYQITKNILWKKPPENRENSLENLFKESMDDKSMESRKEEVNNIYVNNKDVIQPSAVSFKKDTYKENIYYIPDSIFDQNFIDENKCQSHAFRIAKQLKIDLATDDDPWFLFFRRAYEESGQANLDKAVKQLASNPRIDDPKSAFIQEYYRIRSFCLSTNNKRGVDCRIL